MQEKSKETENIEIDLREIFGVLFHRLWIIVVAALVKAGVLFGGYSLFFSLFQFPPKIVNTMLFVSSWPQLVTSSLGIILALLITKRTKN